MQVDIHHIIIIGEVPGYLAGETAQGFSFPSVFGVPSSGHGSRSIPARSVLLGKTTEVPQMVASSLAPKKGSRNSLDYVQKRVGRNDPDHGYNIM